VQGVDVGAKVAIYELLLAAAKDGVTIVLASTDPRDLAPVCDRVIVLRKGRIGAQLHGEGKTVDRILAEILRPSSRMTEPPSP
jgi:ribose transport system ATP-binding protein